MIIILAIITGISVNLIIEYRRYLKMKRIEQIEKDSDRDHWMTSQEAVDYGMIDEILVRNK